MGELTLEQKKALARARARLKLQAPASGLADQFSSGANESIAVMFGSPVDAVTGRLNTGIRAANAIFGTDAGEITNPFGGSASLLGAMDPLISNVDPQTMGQRYARRIGQAVGAGAVAAPLFAALPMVAPAVESAPGVYYAASTMGDVASGLAGQTAREFRPNDPMADLVASIAGGAAGSGMASMMLPKPSGRSIESVRAGAGQMWDDIRVAPDTLTPQATDDLRSAIKGSLPTGQFGPDAYPNAFRMADRTDTMTPPMVSEVADLRTQIGDAVAGDPKEARVGVNMKKAISDYLDNLRPKDVTGGTGDIAGDVKRANALSARAHRYDAIANKEMRGETRAATSGSGGNEVNAIRQNVRTLFDKERDPTLRGQRQGFTPDEMKMMEGIVFGSKGQNAARMLAGLAPSKGVLPMMGSLASAAAGTAGYMSGNPLLAIPALIPGIGLVAKGVSERSTRKAISELLEAIANGAPLPKSSGKDAVRAAILKQILSGPVRQGQQ